MYEVKLGDEFLMSSLFPVAEIELARLGLAACAGAELDVVVGGLGLGYTARDRARGATSALADRRRGPRRGHRLAPEATCCRTPRRSRRDPRTRLVQGDFFALAAAPVAFDAGRPGGACTPCCSTSTTPRGTCCTPATPRSTRAEGLRALPATCTRAGCSPCGPTTRPTTTSCRSCGEVFALAEAHVVEFANPLTGGTSANTVYVAVD